MSCVSCGNPKIDAILNKLPSDLSPSIFSQILMEAPRLYDSEIGLQPESTKSIFLGLLDKRPFPVDQTEYSEIRLTRTSGIQFYDNNELFRKLHDADNCVPGCVWDPKSFEAGREIYSSHMLVSDFQQEIPCYDNMYKKYAFIEFFAKVPEMLNYYMEGIMASFTRNELLARAKKVVLTEETFRSRICDAREWPNMTSFLDGNGNLKSWDLTPSVMLTLLDEKVRLHPDAPGLGQAGGMPVYGLMMEPLQWRLKFQQDARYGDYIRRNPDLSSKFFTQFNTFDTFADMVTFIPSGPFDLPRADIVNGEIVYHYPTIDVPAGESGMKRIGNPAHAKAKLGVALLVGGDVGHLWDEAPIPNQSLPGGVKLGPNYGATQMSNGKWAFLPAYDYDCNPLGKGGKWIAQYKTGFHPGRGIDCLYAILYPLTKYEHEKQALIVTDCDVQNPACSDGYVEDCNVCPGFISCCNITKDRAVVKFDADTGYAAQEVMPLVSKGQEVIDATVNEVVMEEGIYTYLVTLEKELECACIDGVKCQDRVDCFYKVLAQSDCHEGDGEVGLKTDCPADLAAGTVLTAILGDGSEVDVTYVEDREVEGLSYSFFSGDTAEICRAGGVKGLKSQDGEACPDSDLVSPACE